METKHRLNIPNLKIVMFKNLKLLRAVIILQVRNSVSDLTPNDLSYVYEKYWWVPKRSQYANISK